jgi:hypothetical protein
MRDPQNSTQALELANSLIEGTEMEQKVLAWKKKYSPKSSQENEVLMNQLGNEDIAAAE